MVFFSFLPPILFHFLQRDILSDLATKSRREERSNEAVRRLMFSGQGGDPAAEEASCSSSQAGELGLPHLWRAQRVS